MKRFVYPAACLMLTMVLICAPFLPAWAQEELEEVEGISASGLSDFNRTLDLSLDQAKEMALSNNLEVANAKLDLRIAELDIVRARAGYDPYVQADASYSKSNRPSSQSAFGTESETTSVNLTSGINLITGGSMSVDFSNSRQETNSVFSTLNPSYNTDLSLNLRQPLLKNRYQNLRGLEIEQARNELERARLTLESKVYELEAEVEDSYWSLVKARLDLTLSRSSVELSQRMDDLTRAQVRTGVAPDIATIQTEANLASARASLIRAENDYRKAQATLKMTLNVETEDIWSLEITPTDVPDYSPPEYNREEVLRDALANNITIRKSRLALTNAEISNTMAKNRTLPQLDARGSVSLTGLAGTDRTRTQVTQTGFVVPNPLPRDQFPQPYILETAVVEGEPSEFDGDYVDALENMLDEDNLSWSAGVTFNMPIGNRSARADLERTLISYEKLVSDMDNQKRQVMLNMINLVYDLEAAHRSYIAAREARRLQEQNLSTEEKKFSLGLSTSYEVMQARESFEEARSGEIGALIEYTKALGRMDRARKGYLAAGAVSSVPVSMPATVSAGMAGAAAGGIDESLLQQFGGSLPAGIDINQLKSMMP